MSSLFDQIAQYAQKPTAHLAKLDPLRHEAEVFIKALTGSLDTPVTWQLFDEAKVSGEKDLSLSCYFHGTLAERWNELVSANRRGAGIFLMVNEGDLHGRSISNVRAPRALFIDEDGVDPKSGQAKRLEDKATFGVEGEGLFHGKPPSITVDARAGEHNYWVLVTGQLHKEAALSEQRAAKVRQDFERHKPEALKAGKSEDFLQSRLRKLVAQEYVEYNNAFKKAQLQLAQHFGTDVAVADLPRVMRCPGFFNLKHADKPYLIRVKKTSERRYTIDEVLGSYPLPFGQSVEVSTAPKGKNKPTAKDMLRMAEYDEAPQWLLDEARDYIDSRYPEIKDAGQGGDQEAFNVASFLINDLALHRDEAEPLFRHKCENYHRWSEDFMDQKLSNAEAYAKGIYGEKRERWEQNREIKESRGETDATVIYVTEDLVSMTDEAIAALAKDRSIYQRANQIVRIQEDPREKGSITMPRRSPVIRVLPQQALKETLAAVALWKKATEKGFASVRPDMDVVATVVSRGNWPTIRHLEGVSETAFLRADGSVCSKKGYDSASGIYLSPVGDIGEVPRYTQAEAKEAAKKIVELTADFPFAHVPPDVESGDPGVSREVYQAGWLSSVLTPFARFAFEGPSPLFAVDANTRGTGKSLLAAVGGIIAFGAGLSTSVMPETEDEMRKVITSQIMQGARYVLLDNITRPLGGAALDAVLTSTVWKDRVLGESMMVEMPAYAVWYATGNNIKTEADTARRTVHIRLSTDEAKPEERTSSAFRHPNLKAHVLKHRPEYARMALGILHGYVASDCPGAEKLPGWGSFEDWSRVVRGAVVWAGMPDPADARKRLAEQADKGAETFSQFAQAWQDFFGDSAKKGMTASEIARELCDQLDSFGKRPTAKVADIFEAVENATRTKPQDVQAGTIGRVLTRFADRVTEVKTKDGKLKKVRFVSKNSNSKRMWKLEDVA